VAVLGYRVGAGLVHATSAAGVLVISAS